MHSKDARPASFQIQNGGWAIRALIWKKTESSFYCIVSFLKPKPLRRPSWWDLFAVRTLSETTLLIKFKGGQNPSMSLWSPVLSKMAIFLQSRAFPLTGTLFLIPPPPQRIINMIWNKVQGVWLPSKSVGTSVVKRNSPVTWPPIVILQS